MATANSNYLGNERPLPIFKYGAKFGIHYQAAKNNSTENVGHYYEAILEDLLPFVRRSPSD